jgi:HSP20 family molecular chaperone IbpA
MLLERFDPFLAEFDRLTQRTFGTADGVGLPMDVLRRGEELVVRVDLPGVAVRRGAEETVGARRPCGPPGAEV